LEHVVETLQHQVAAITRGHADHGRILAVMQPEVETNARNVADLKAVVNNWYFLQLIQ
jgi:hypothetical protein